MRQVLLAAVVLGAIVAPASAGMGVQVFQSYKVATQRCRGPIVWLNLQTMIYYVQGSHWYGALRGGAWACQDAAIRAGARQAINDQQV